MWVQIKQDEEKYSRPFDESCSETLYTAGERRTADQEIGNQLFTLQRREALR